MSSRPGQGQYDLDKLDDIPYLEKLSELNDYWDALQAEILIYRGILATRG